MSKGSTSASTFTLKMTAPPRLERPSTSRNPSPSATVRESVFPAIWDFDPASVALESNQMEKAGYRGLRQTSSPVPP